MSAAVLDDLLIAVTSVRLFGVSLPLAASMISRSQASS